MKIGTNATSLSPAVEKSPALRAAVPVSVADKLGLEKGDRAKWDFDRVDGERTATVRKRPQ